MRGTVIRYNYFHHISGFRGPRLRRRVPGRSVLRHRDLRQPVLQGDAGGDDRRRPRLHDRQQRLRRLRAGHARGRPRPGLGGFLARHDWRTTLAAVPYQNALWASRYPKLVHILDQNPMAPVDNLIARNICVRGRWGDFETVAKPLVTFQDNLLDRDPRFVDPEHHNFQLKDDSPAYKLGFERIPLEKIGLYATPQCASWPVRPE